MSMPVSKGDLFASKDRRDRIAGTRIVRALEDAIPGMKVLCRTEEHWNERQIGREHYIDPDTLRAKYVRVSR